MKSTNTWQKSQKKKLLGEKLEKKIDKFTTENLRLQEQIKKIKDQGVEYERKRQGLDTKIKSRVERINRLQRQINAEKAKALKDTSAETAKRQAEIEKKSKLLETAKVDLASTIERREQVEQDYAAFNSQVETVDTKVSDVTRQLSNFSRTESQLLGQRSDNMEVFGKGMRQLLELIQKNKNRFSQPPIGPLGLFIKMKNGQEKWTTAAEAVLTSVMARFLVATEKDSSVFKQLAHQADRSPHCFIVDFRNNRKYDLPSSNLPDRTFTTVLDVVEISEPLVYNVVIDQAKIERNILIEDPIEARRVMFGRQTLRNVTQCNVLSGDRLFITNGSQNYVANQDSRKFLNVDVEARLKEIRQKITEVKIQLDQVKSEKRDLDNRRTPFRHDLDNLKNKMNKLTLHIGNYEREISDLQNVRVEEPPDTTELEENLAIQTAEKETFEKELEEHENSSENNSSAILKPLKIQYQNQVKELSTFTDEQTTVSDQVRELVVNIEQVKNSLTYHGQQVATIQKQLDQAQLENSEKKEALEEAKAKALKFCAPVAVTKTTAQIDAELKALIAKMQREEAGRKKSPAEINKQYKNAKQRFTEIEKDLKRLGSFCDVLQKNYDSRVRRFRAFQKSISTRTTALFNAHLSQKGFSGTIQFDHEARTLEISVELENALGENNVKKSKKIKDTKALSGGERSYSTVALLLALWEAMENPFRAMDEFDVFMDSVNRQISIQLLIESARDRPNRQFIFITPHDHSVISNSPDIRIHKMHPPERGQSTLVTQGD
eukprot:TRINITY_DN4195_c0_g1_i2.p1 TRINITY_DN4195_c0_g1~~TRINITY_DN4195_c0_g1_i2.p1  ORF type:complete len:776 (-),score=273.26 TRINITY_DN4195_c0_g1_i2:229-2556(-)